MPNDYKKKEVIYLKSKLEKALSLRLSGDTLNWIEDLAKKSEKKVSEILREAVVTYRDVKTREAKEGKRRAKAGAA